MSERRKTLHRLGLVGYLAIVSGGATLIAMTVGIFVLVVVAFPFSLLGFVMHPLLVSAVCMAFAFAAPTTLLVLPLTTALLRKHAMAGLFLLPALGLAAGGTTMWTYFHVATGSISEPFLVAGMLAGLTAGIVFSRSLFEIAR